MMFSLIMALGVVIGVGWLALRAPDRQRLQVVDDSVVVLIGSLLGSRLGYVLVNWGYYQQHWLEALQFWLGGLSGVGAALGAVLTLALLAWTTRQPLDRLAARMLPLLVALPAAGWLGCWQAGCAYGFETSGWWGLPAVDEWGVAARRIPVQLIGALLAVAIPWVLENLLLAREGQVRQRAKTVQPSPAAGQTACLGLLGLALVLFGLSFLRADPTLVWFGLRPDAWGALLLGILSILIFVVRAAARNTKKEAI